MQYRLPRIGNTYDLSSSIPSTYSGFNFWLERDLRPSPQSDRWVIWGHPSDCPTTNRFGHFDALSKVWWAYNSHIWWGDTVDRNGWRQRSNKDFHTFTKIMLFFSARGQGKDNYNYLFLDLELVESQNFLPATTVWRIGSDMKWIRLDWQILNHPTKGQQQGRILLATMIQLMLPQRTHVLLWHVVSTSYMRVAYLFMNICTNISRF